MPGRVAAAIPGSMSVGVRALAPAWGDTSAVVDTLPQTPWLPALGTLLVGAVCCSQGGQRPPGGSTRGTAGSRSTLCFVLLARPSGGAVVDGGTCSGDVCRSP